jgi:hypothetical protein
MSSAKTGWAEGPYNVLRTIGHGCLLMILLFITLLMSPLDRPVSTATPEMSWQSSQKPVVKLGIRDKTGSLDQFTASCIVSAPDGSKHLARVTVRRLGWGYVWYPDDFQAYAKPGRYSWKWLVDGRQVAAGFFEFRSVASYSDQLEVP